MWNRRTENNKASLILIFSSLIIVFSVLGYFTQKKLKNISANQFGDKKFKVASSDNEVPTKQLWSQGSQVLITANGGVSKIEGSRAYQNKNYQKAQVKFRTSLENYHNDPEALIYLNNSKALFQGNELTIGVSVPIGRNLNVAQEILRGVAQAQDEFNSQRGEKDRLLKVIIANDDNNPTLAKKIATQFVQEGEIMAVVGHNASNSSLAAAPIYQEGGIIMITPTSSAKSLTDVGRYIYRTTPSTRDLADRLADYVINKAHKTNIAVCLDTEAKASVSFKSDFTWAVYHYGGVINGVKCDFSAADFNPAKIPTEVISNGADALLLAPSLRYLNQAIEVARANQQQLSLFGSHSVFSFTTLKEGQVNVNGLVLPVAWYPKINEDSSFTQHSQKLWGKTGSWRTAMAYDATQVILEGLKQTSSRQRLQEIVQNPNFKSYGASGLIRFMQNGDRISKGVLVRIEPGKKSGVGYDFAYVEQDN